MYVSITIDDFSAMNGVYAQYFKMAPPVRTTVQQIAPVEQGRTLKAWPTLEQVSIIAVK